MTSFNELKLFTSFKTISTAEFYNCSNLVAIDCRNVTARATGDPHTFSGCSKLVKLVLRNFSGYFGYNGSINTNRSILKNCSSLKRLIMPSCVNLDLLSEGAGTPVFTMMDFGQNLSVLCRYTGTSYSSALGINNSTVIVIRSTTPATGNATQIGRIRKLFVPASALQEWRESSSFSPAASYIFAIGGEEWVSLYGSSSEDANLTQEEYDDNYGSLN